MVIVSSALLRFTASDYPFGILWSLCRLLFFDLRLVITPLVSCGHCVVCLFFDLRLVITPLVSCGHCVVCLLRFTASDYPFGILWSLCRLLFFDLRLVITPLVSCGHCVVCSSSITPLVSCGHCVVCSSSIYG